MLNLIFADEKGQQLLSMHFKCAKPHVDEPAQRDKLLITGYGSDLLTGSWRTFRASCLNGNLLDWRDGHGKTRDFRDFMRSHFTLLFKAELALVPQQLRFVVLHRVQRSFCKICMLN